MYSGGVRWRERAHIVCSPVRARLTRRVVLSDSTVLVKRCFVPRARWQVQPGELANTSVLPASLVVSTETTVTVKFTVCNAVPADGAVKIKFDNDFVAVQPTPDGTAGRESIADALAIETDGNSVTLTAMPPEEPFVDDEESDYGDAEADEDADAAAAEGDGEGEGEGGEEAKKAPPEPADPWENPLVEAGATVVIRLDGITNPSTPGVRSQGARKDRTYSIWTMTSTGAIIDESTNVSASKFTTSVKMKMLLKFLFPPGQQHPRSSGRLFVFGLYGPLDERGKLRGGKFGTHTVSEPELKCMVDEIYREDILSIYIKEKNITTAQKEEILARASPNVKEHLTRNFTKQEVKDLFAALPRDDVGGLSFHALQARTREARQQRVRECRLMT